MEPDVLSDFFLLLMLPAFNVKDSIYVTVVTVNITKMILITNINAISATEKSQTFHWKDGQKVLMEVIFKQEV